MAGHSDYHRGEQEITDQKETFSGFIKASAWGTLLVAMLVLHLAVAFASPLGWWSGLAAALVVGVVGGLLVRLGGAWIAAVMAYAVIFGLVGIIKMLLGVTSV
jgi:site-specific recombinase